MSSAVQLVQIPNQPNMKDLLDLLKKDVFLSLNCHAIGTIQSFNANTVAATTNSPIAVGQTARVTINYPKTLFQLNSAGVYQAVQVPYPVLIDCPAIVLGGGNCATTYPIAAGDECLVLYNDRDMDNWFVGGAGSPVASSRLHSFSDAIVLVGLNSSANVWDTYDAVRAVLRGGSAVIGVNPSTNKVLVTNDSPSGTSGNYTYSTTLNTLLQNLLTQLQDLTTALAALTVTGVSSGTSTSGVPANATNISYIGTQIGTIATDIGGLLE